MLTFLSQYDIVLTLSKRTLMPLPARGTGGLPDQLWRINLGQAGSHMAGSGSLAKAELDESVSLADDPNLLTSAISELRRGAKTPRIAVGSQDHPWLLTEWAR